MSNAETSMGGTPPPTGGMPPPTGGPNIYDTAAGAYGSGMGAYDSMSGSNLGLIGSNMAGGMGSTNINAMNSNMAGGAGANAIAGSGNTIDQLGTYTNPYTNDVINNTMTDMSRANDMQLDQNAANASAAGAFGGGRHGLVDATTRSDTVRNMGNMAGQLRNQGFNTAASLAAGHVGQDMQRGQSMAGLEQQDYGNQFAQGQNQQAMQGQDLAQVNQDWQNQYNQTGQNANIANAQGNAYMNAGDTMFNQGDASVAMQTAAGNTAQGENQAIMNSAAQIFDGNSIDSIMQNLSGALSGNPLSGNNTGTSTRTPSGAEKAGLVLDGVGSMMGK